MTHDRVVVVGGGVAGVTTASALRSQGYDGEIVLVERARFPYDRPPLSKGYLAGERTLEDIELQPRSWYADNDVHLVGCAEVSRLEPSEDSVGVVLADGRTWAADVAVLSMGGRALRPPVPGMEDPRVHVLRDARDADALRPELRRGARLLVVGAGLIGAEAASTARALGADVVMVDPVDPPLRSVVGAELASFLHHQHRDNGVEVVTGVVAGISGDSSGPLLARLSGEDRDREFDAVLVGVGIRPETSLAVEAGLEVDDGIVVDDGQRSSHPRVFAVGDAARRRGHRREEHWEGAQRSGLRAAASILGQEAPEESASWFWSDRYDAHVEGVGEMACDQVDSVVLRGVPGSAPTSAFALRAGRVVGAAAVNDVQTVRAARRLIDRSVVVEPQELSDPQTDLRQLVRRAR